MFGLCMPTGEVFLLFKNGKKESIAIEDMIQPKKEILEEDYILNAVKYYGYKNIDAIVYERNNKTTKVNMAEYYYENAKRLEEVK